jgi:hypothetical protein
MRKAHGQDGFRGDTIATPWRGSIGPLGEQLDTRQTDGALEDFEDP